MSGKLAKRVIQGHLPCPRGRSRRLDGAGFLRLFVNPAAQRHFTRAGSSGWLPSGVSEPGALSVGVLLASGLTRAECSLEARWFSKAGAAMLMLIFLLLLPIVLSSTGEVGWDPLPALVYAPASGIAQEVFFRSALLPALTRAFRGRIRLALPIHSLIFVAYHFRTFRAIGAIGPSIGVAMVLFLGGLGWGWQAQKDRTVIWTAIQHSIFLAVMSLFIWG